MKVIVASIMLLLCASPATFAGFYETADAKGCRCGDVCPCGPGCKCGDDCPCNTGNAGSSHCVLGPEYFYPKVPVRVPLRRPRGYVWNYQPTGLFGLLGGGRRVYYQEW